MEDIPFVDYVPPNQVKEYQFSLRQNVEDHVRLLWWARHCGSQETRRRATAARYAIRAFLDSQDVPSMTQIIQAAKNPQPRRRAIDRFLDKKGIPVAEDMATHRERRTG